jgi:ribonuclease R
MYALSRKAPMLYRIHDEPLPLSLEEVLPTLKEFGYTGESVPQTSLEIQAILDKSVGKPEHYLISTLLLRAMKTAKYATSYTTHFGLSSKGYTHFTSPIRRYPDLMVHRLLKCLLFGEALPDTMEKQLDGICKHSSERERATDQASAEALDIKLCEYLAPRCGELFWGIITSVNSYGVAVREDSTTAVGFIKAEDLGSEYVFEANHYRYHDPDSGKYFRLGQALHMKLVGVDRQRSKLQFVIA